MAEPAHETPHFEPGTSTCECLCPACTVEVADVIDLCVCPACDGDCGLHQSDRSATSDA